MEIKKVNEINSELQNYLDNSDENQTVLTIFLNNNENKDYYKKLGKYIIKTFNGELPKELKFIENSINKRKNSTVAIFFLTGVLSDDILRKIFGEPILHNEFGEGFEGYNDNNDNDNVSYASYFVEINGVKMHIGYDHRGTNIDTDESDANKVYGALKKLVDMTKEVICK